MTESRFPLTQEKLPKLHVDAHTVADWKQSAKDEIRKLLMNRKSWYYRGPRTSKKKSVFDKKGVHGYTLSAESSRKKDFYAQGVLRLSLEDIAYALYCEDTSQQRLVNAYLDEEYFLDAAVLSVYAKRSVEDPFHFAGVKWVAYNSPPGVVTQYSDPSATSKSDFVYFEYSCKTRDADGKIVLVQCISSPQLSSEQLVEHHVGLARGKDFQITTFRFMEDGTQYQSMGSFEAGKQVPAWVSMRCALNTFNSITNLVGLADVRAISSLSSASVAVATTKTCYLCKKKFGLMRARLNCHSCGQCICRQCTLKVKFFDEKGLFSDSTPLLSEDKFCLQCVRQSREQRPERGSFCEVVDSISSEESNTTLRTSLDEQLHNHRQQSYDSYDSYADSDLSDLHDSIDDSDDECVATPSRQHQHFDRNGARRTQKHEPVYTDKVVSIKGSSRTLLRSSPQHSQQQQETVTQKSKPQLSPVEAYLARAKAEATTAATAKKNTKNQKPESSAYGVPVTGPGSDMFNKLTQSIAAQEKLLASIQQEARKIRARTTSSEYQSSSLSSSSSPSSSSSASSSPSTSQRRHRPAHIPESDRFEIVTDA